MKHGHYGRAACALLVVFGGFWLTSPAAAADPAAKASAANTAVVAASNDTLALVAPIALYPDPILAVVLQASTLPLQVVQADRFLAKRVKDPKLQPDPDWDPSILGLLNYPKQLGLMVEYLDWTEALGNAVVDDLNAVQASIQDLRTAAYHAGWLKSNTLQKVTLEAGVVRISPADPKKTSIPEYDAAALLAAIDELEQAEEAADTAAAVAAAPAKTAAPAPGAAPTPGTAVTDAGTAAAYATYDVTPPAIAYGQPQDTFWSSAATFAGGAVVGGLLGWALADGFDDDDDDWEDWWDDDDWDNEDIQDRLRDQQGYRQNAATDRREHRQQATDDRREFRQGQTEDRKGSLETRRQERQDVVGDRPETREDRAARAREQLSGRPPAQTSVGGAPGGGAAASPGIAAAQPGLSDHRAKRDVALPGAGTQPGVSEKIRQRDGVQPIAATAGRPPTAAKLQSPQRKRASDGSGFAREASGQGIAASAGASRQVHKEASRGARSCGGGAAINPASFSSGDKGGGSALSRRSGGGGNGIAAGHNRGSGAKAEGTRGRASREGGGRRNR